VYLATLSPRSLELTGEIADGWLGTSFMPEHADVFLQHIAAGAARAGRSIADLDLHAGGTVAFGDDLALLIAPRKPGLAFSLGAMGSRQHNFYNDAYRRAGYEDAAVEVQRLWLGGRRDEAAARVPDEMVLATNLLGTDAMVRQRIRAYRDAGITTLRVEPAGTTLGERIGTLAHLMDLVESVGDSGTPAPPGALGRSREPEVEAGDALHRRSHYVAAGPRHHEQNQDEGPVLLDLVQERPRRAREDVRQEVAPVERWQRDQVEDAEAEIEPVDPEEHTQDRLAEKRCLDASFYDLEGDEPDQGHGEVRERARHRNHRHIPARVAQIVGVDRDRLRPAEARDDEGQRAERVDMGQRIARNAPLETGCRIAEAIGDEGMSQFVERHGDQERRDLQNEPPMKAAGSRRRDRPSAPWRRRACQEATRPGGDSSRKLGTGMR
jgi:hypothetical protein